MGQLMSQDPFDTPIRQYALMLGVALLGGLVSWATKVRKGELKAHNVMQLVGELATSAFAGLLAFWLCQWANTPGPLMAALVGIAGHMGTRAIGAFESWASRHWIETTPKE
jgi:CHASE2 domain-containing sensor protein